MHGRGPGRRATSVSARPCSSFYAGGRSLSIEEVRALGERFAPYENLSAQYLLAGAKDGRVNVRRAVPDDLEAVSDLWREFDHEVPPPTHEGPADVEKELGEVAGDHRLGGRIRRRGRRWKAHRLRPRPGGAAHGVFGTLTDIYVTRDARRSGIGTQLMREVLSAFRALGIEQLDLEVLAWDAVARSLYARWGLRDEVMSDDRRGRRQVSEAGARRAGGVVLRVDPPPVRQPERGGAGGAPVRAAPSTSSRGSIVAPPRDGWITVYDDVCDRNPEMLRRLGRELSDRMGAVTCLLGLEREELVRMILFERGKIVDEYVSVPEFDGPLAPGRRRRAGPEPDGRHQADRRGPCGIRQIARTAAAPAECLPRHESWTRSRPMGSRARPMVGRTR